MGSDAKKEDAAERTVVFRFDALAAMAALAIVAAVSMFLALGYARQARTYEQALGECRDAKIAAAAKLELVDGWLRMAHPDGGKGGR